MTRKVRRVPPSMTLVEAAELMREWDVGVLSVCGKSDELVGLLTDRDITIRAVASGRDPESCTVGETLEEISAPGESHVEDPANR